MKVITCAFVATLLIVLSACQQPEEDPKEEDDDVVIESIIFKKHFDSIKFWTNDSTYYNYAFFKSYGETLEGPMDQLNIVVNKNSGSEGASFGAIFCVQDKDNFYLVGITINGYYIARKQVDDEWTTLIDWTESGDLNTGYKPQNTLAIEYDQVDTFDIYINDNFVTSFQDSSFNGGESGFYASVGSALNEDFPNKPEALKFVMALPVWIPESAGMSLFGKINDDTWFEPLSIHSVSHD